MAKIRIGSLYHTREIDEADTERMVKAGWFVVPPPSKAPSANARLLRDFKRRKRLLGFRRLDVLLPATAYAALLAQKREGEPLSDLLTRLISGKVSAQG